MYLLQTGGKRQGARARCSAPARSCARCIAAAEMLEKEFGVPADVFSVPSFTELRREALDVERWNRAASRASRRACRTCAQALRRAHGPVHRGHGLHADVVPGPDPPVGARPLSSCSAPTASAAATGRAALRKHFEVDAQAHRRRGAAARSPTKASSTGRPSEAAHRASSASIPTSRTR